MLRQNAWNVIWKDSVGKKKLRIFEGDSPRTSGAIDFGKKLQDRGLRPDVVSRRHAFAPPRNKLKPPDTGLLWCPYCLKWREFRDFAIRVDGIIGPSNYRCPVCIITIKDAYVRKYNEFMVQKLEGTKVKLPSEKKIRQTAATATTGRRKRR